MCLSVTETLVFSWFASRCDVEAFQESDEVRSRFQGASQKARRAYPFITVC